MQTPITSPTIPTTAGALTTAISLATFSQGTYLAAQIAGAGPNDVFALWAATQSGLTSTTQMAPVPGFQGAVDSQGNVTGWAGPLPVEGGTPIRTNFVYIQRVAGTTPGLTAVFNGQETPGTQAGNPNAILNGGNAFGGPITIGATDGSSVTLGGLSAGNTNIVAQAGSTVNITSGGASASITANNIALHAGSGGGITLLTDTTGAVSITGGTGTSNFNVGAAGTLNLATSNNNATVSIATGGAAGVVTTTVGSVNGASSTKIAFGSGGLGLGVAAPGSSGIAIDTPAAGAITVGGTNATSLALTGATLATINIGTTAFATTVTMGNATGATRVRVNTGTGGFGVNVNPDASAMVDFNGTTTQGVRFPNMSTVQKNAIVAPALGLVVYDTTLNKLCVWTGAWQTVTSA